jgi:hypothetical protein
MYLAHYTPADSSDLAAKNTADQFNDEADAQDLATIRANCTENGLNAKLSDEPGFARGWVKADGNYTLS